MMMWRPGDSGTLGEWTWPWTMCLCPVILPLLPQRCTENTWDSHAIVENCAVPSPIVHAQAVDSRDRELCQVASSSPMCPLCGHYFTCVYSKGSFSVDEG